jgi:hypothetical protein
MLTPFPMLVRARLPSRKKVILLGIFSLGIFITVIQIIRILTIKSLADYIDSSKLIMWSMVENNLGIIVASIPALAPLVRSFQERSSNKSSGGGASRQRGPYSLRDFSRKNKVCRVSGSEEDNEVAQERSESRETNAVWDIEGSSEQLNRTEETFKTTEHTVDHEPRARDKGGGQIIYEVVI